MKIGDLVVYDNEKCKRLHGKMALVTKVYLGVVIPLCDIIWVGSGSFHKGIIQEYFKVIP